MAFYQPKKPGEDTPDAFNGFNANAGAGQIDSPTQSKSSFGSLMSYLSAQPDRFDRSTTGIDRGEAAGRAAAPIKETAKYETSLQMADGSAPAPQRTSTPVEQTAAEKAAAVREQSLGGAGNFKSHDASGRVQDFSQQFSGTNQLVPNSGRVADTSTVTNSNPLINNVASYAATGDAKRQAYMNLMNGDLWLNPSDADQKQAASYNNRIHKSYDPKINALPSAPVVTQPGQIGYVSPEQRARDIAYAQLGKRSTNDMGQGARSVDPSSVNALMTQIALNALFYSDKNLKTDIDETTGDDITQILNELSGVK